MKYYHTSQINLRSIYSYNCQISKHQNPSKLQKLPCTHRLIFSPDGSYRNDILHGGIGTLFGWYAHMGLIEILLNVFYTKKLPIIL